MRFLSALRMPLARGREDARRLRGFLRVWGTALGEGFIEGLKVLGKKGFVFDVGVDQHRRGRVQLEEVVEMIDRAHDGVEEDDKVVFVLSEYCPVYEWSFQLLGLLLTLWSRSPLQTRSHDPQPDRPVLHRVVSRARP